MCYISIYSVTKNHVSLLIKAKGYNFFLRLVMKKKVEAFFSVNVKCTKIQEMACKHTQWDQVEEAVSLLTIEALL